MEIERKYLIRQIPFSLENYKFHQIEQAYLCTEPVLRIRREDNNFYITYKSKGLMIREEHNLPLTEDSYHHLLGKADGNIITKKRYKIPYTNMSGSYTIELDIFSGIFEGLILAEVEFKTEEEALAFLPPDWFGKDVTFSSKYHNSTLSSLH
ncbi:MAG: CYTH domain-containing protein [Lachnospiraceae bacterium]|nr:CYTH domain-containing protein [Lachnospiraceae bacterium]